MTTWAWALLFHSCARIWPVMLKSVSWFCLLEVELEKRLPLAKKINPNIDPQEVEAMNQTLYLTLVEPRIQEPLIPADHSRSSNWQDLTRVLGLSPVIISLVFQRDLFLFQWLGESGQSCPSDSDRLGSVLNVGDWVVTFLNGMLSLKYFLCLVPWWTTGCHPSP